jgi:hypothetical protein
MQLKTSDISIEPELTIEKKQLLYGENKSRGAVYTRLEVVDLILDLVGYTVDKPLYEFRILEPSFGNGSFLLPVIKRLIQSYKNDKKNLSKTETGLNQAVRAVELHRAAFLETKAVIIEYLKNEGISEIQSKSLAESWLICGDFLLKDFKGSFTHVVGNPPYIRQELIPPALIAEYRKRFKTVYDRADIYIPFIEKSLSLLSRKGILGFICSDRWMKNRYGRPLRQLINDEFFLKYHIDMNDVSAFHSEVISYPAITVIQNDKSGNTTVLNYSDILNQPVSELISEKGSRDSKVKLPITLKLADEIFNSAPWILNKSREADLIQRLEREFPTIEQTNCKVGIGVATGADKAFINKFDDLDVEPDRKLPIVMTRDISSGEIKWRGYGIINPFQDNGGLVSLGEYPKLSNYLERHSEQIKKRHVAKRDSEKWYRTIDRIYPALTKTPKLLIPDIKGEANVVYERGDFYPHHNLYYITAKEWNLTALQAVLMSGIAKLFVSVYSTRMRGGFMRFQAQYLRRIRLPHWQNIAVDLRQKLIEASMTNNQSNSRILVSKIYNLTGDELKVLDDISEKKGNNSK